MLIAVFETMALSLWRDRSAFALTFLLPPAIYIIFALVFSSAAGGDLSIRLAVLAGEDALSNRLVRELSEAPEISMLLRAEDADDLHDKLQTGAASAGLEIIRTEGKSAPDFMLHQDATRQAAAFAAEKALARLRPSADGNGDGDGATLQRAFVNPVNASAPMAAYYAGGVAVLFLFLSGFQSALTLIEERDAKVLDRAIAGKNRLGPIVDGKFAFIVVQGVAQCAIILLTATLLFGVDLRFAPLTLFAVVLACALCSAGVTLAVTSLCQSRPQAHAIGTVLSLVFAAVGGSMAPMFLMPEAIQSVGAATPNGLAVAGFGAALWRGQSFAAALAPVGLLVAYGAAGLLVARIATARALMRRQ